MPSFPRTEKPRKASMPEVAGPLMSVGQSGKAQIRGTMEMGHRWTEEWPPLLRGDPDVAALLDTILSGHGAGTFFDVQHLYQPGSGLAPNGAGGGTPLVQGASQTGSSLVTDGWSTGITNVVRRGDVIKIAGLNNVFRITADANSDGSGVATLSIAPSIPAGSSPANDAAITRTGVLYRCYIESYQMPSGGPGIWLAGLKVTFREQP